MFGKLYRAIREEASPGRKQDDDHEGRRPIRIRSGGVSDPRCEEVVLRFNQHVVRLTVRPSASTISRRFTRNGFAVPPGSLRQRRLPA